MSEMYEGVVFRADEASARAAFAAAGSPLRLRLVRLAEGTFGVYRVAGRGDAFDRHRMQQVAAQISSQVGRSAAFFYDNRSGACASVLYCGGEQGQEFCEADEWWAPLGEDGEPIRSGPRFRSSELRPDQEYECIHSAIDAGLEILGTGSDVTGETLKQAFCYEKFEGLAQSNPVSGGT